MVRVPAGGGAVQGGDGGSWRGRQRRRALAWEAVAMGIGAGVGGGGGRWRGRQRHARGSRERAGLDWVSFAWATDSVPKGLRVHTVKRSKTRI